MPTLYRITVLVQGSPREGIVAVLDEDPDTGAYCLPHPDVLGTRVGPQFVVGTADFDGFLVRLGPPTITSICDDERSVALAGSDLLWPVGALFGYLDLRDIAGTLPLPYVLDADPTPRDGESGEPFDMMERALDSVG